MLNVMGLPIAVLELQSPPAGFYLPVAEMSVSEAERRAYNLK